MKVASQKAMKVVWEEGFSACLVVVVVVVVEEEEEAKTWLLN